MPIGDVCTREVLVAPTETTIVEAAQIMRKHHVGDLIVVKGQGDIRIPSGIVTDRDIVLSVVATGLDPTVFTLGDLVTDPLITVRQDLGVFECIQRMRMYGVRRMPVVNLDEELVGIISVDDLVQLLGKELSDLGSLIVREQAKELSTRQ